ncbi:MAG TPA: hypothetical protein PL156_04405 [Rhodoglobus sp.]|jgi:hypothetical protein|nr:hypothetical protein [Rhodoglobus sp.]
MPDSSPLRTTQCPCTTSAPSANQRHARSKDPTIGWWSASKIPTNSPVTMASAALTLSAFDRL